MNSSVQQQLSDALAQLSQLYPDWRFGQLIANVAVWAKGPVDSATWDVTDEEMLAAAKSHLDQHQLAPMTRKTA